jgi:hypothetical protein
MRKPDFKEISGDFGSDLCKLGFVMGLTSAREAIGNLREALEEVQRLTSSTSKQAHIETCSTLEAMLLKEIEELRK